MGGDSVPRQPCPAPPTSAKQHMIPGTLPKASILGDTEYRRQGPCALELRAHPGNHETRGQMNYKPQKMSLFHPFHKAVDISKMNKNPTKVT